MMNILRNESDAGGRPVMRRVTSREIVLEHALLLRKASHNLAVIHSKTLALENGSGIDPSVFQSFLKRTANGLESDADEMERLAERARHAAEGIPAWGFILQMGVAIALAFGLLVGFFWLTEPPQQRSQPLTVEEERIVVPETAPATESTGRGAQ